MKLNLRSNSTAFLRVTGLIISFSFVSLNAQNYLRVYKPGSTKSYKIKEGDVLKVKYEGKKTRFRLLSADTGGLLLQSGDERIKVQADKLANIWIQPKNGWTRITGGLTSSVPAFLLVFGIAGLVNSNNFTNAFSPDINGVQVMLGLCVVAPIVYALIKWKKIGGKKWTFLVVDFRHLR